MFQDFRQKTLPDRALTEVVPGWGLDELFGCQPDKSKFLSIKTYYAHEIYHSINIQYLRFDIKNWLHFLII